jgi:fatty-acyl-CoA synthase
MHCFLTPHLLLGASSLLIDAPEPGLVLRLIEEQRITAFFAPPTVWIALPRHTDFDRHDVGSLQRIYYGASIMPVPARNNIYGQSEIGPLATVRRPEEHDQRPASCGPPGQRRDAHRRRRDARRRARALAARSSTAHRSCCCATGTSRRRPNRPSPAAGSIQATSPGIVVSGREVEEALFTHPAVYEVAVIALPDPTWIEAVTAVVVLRPGADASATELIEHARSALAPFKVPKRVIFTDALPRNTAGKLLKRELRTTYATAAGA